MSAPEVRTSAGLVRGITTSNGTAAFLGIPYAEPATGTARFAEPKPRAAWDDVLDASAHGPTSLQGPYPPPMDALLPSSVSPGDDYLNLSVWTLDPAASGLPVIVWIHGGAFVRGANSVPTYDGAAFARDGVVLVGINYRLGVPGFPVLPDAATNLALRDQLLALRWVQDNVAAFGGDPANVTIMGESAGGMSVATLMAMPAAKGLFKQAIIESGGGVSAGLPDELGSITRAVAEKLGVDATAEGLGAVSADDLLAAQNAVSLDLVLDPRPERWGASTIRGGFGIMPVFPAVDGDLLPGVPEALIADGASSDVPLLTGTTRQEFNLWAIGLNMAAAVTDDNLAESLGRYGIPPQIVDGYVARRPGKSAGEVFSDVITDLLFREPTLRIAQARTGSAPTFVYEFDWASPTQGIGACHALELPFVFDTLGDASSVLAGPTAPQEIATAMHAAWVAFAKSGDPGWAAYNTDTRTTRRFATDGPETVDDPRGDDHRAWG